MPYTEFFARTNAAQTGGPSAEQSAVLPVGTLVTGAMNRRLEAVLSGNDDGLELDITTLAQTTRQDLVAGFVGPELAAQTIASGTWSMTVGASESNAPANLFSLEGCLYVWRPSGGGSLVGRIFDSSTQWGVEVAATYQTRTLSGVSLAVQAGDRLVWEAWFTAVQSMATAYTLSVNGYDTAHAEHTKVVAPSGITLLSEAGGIREEEYFHFPRGMNDSGIVTVFS